MQGRSFFKIYHSIKLHFNSESYDAVKYRGEVRNFDEVYQNLKNKVIFDRWGQTIKNSTNAGNLCVSNFMMNIDDGWIFSEKKIATEILETWMETHDKITTSIVDEFKKLSKLLNDATSFQNLLNKTPSGKSPPMLQLYLSGKVLPDTIIALDRLDSFLVRWKSEYDNDPVISQKLFKLGRFNSFCRYKEETVEAAYDNYFS